MEKRLSLAELKAKATTSVVKNAEFFTGGEESGCHYVIAPITRDGTTVQPMIPR